VLAKASNSARLLVVSREPSSLGPLWSVGQANAWNLEIAGSGCEALERIQSDGGPDLVLLDLPRGDNDGFYTLRWLRRVRANLPVVLLAPVDDPVQRAEGLRLGAQEYLVKPLEARALENMARHYFGGSVVAFEEAAAEPLGEGMAFLAGSPVTRKLRAQAELLAQVDVPLLILGEGGSGKESVARLIHKMSARAKFGFHKINCAAMGGDLLERDLMGYEPGAFAGATRSRAGKLELADKGTIFLDDFAETPLNLQAKLLHILQEREFFRMGAESAAICDVRIMAATSANIEQALAGKQLREDLYYRLSAFTVQVPPLRQRAGEIPQLLAHFIKQLATRYNLPMRSFSRPLVDACQAYPWPGNFRELEGFLQRYLIMGDEQLLLSELLKSTENPFPAIEPRPAGEISDPEEHLSGLRSLVQNVKGEAEKNAITAALEETHWNRKAAARLLKVSYRTLLYKIQQYHMSPPAAYASPFSAQPVHRPKALRGYAASEVTEPRQ
jgi:two-component system, NtrC family, response regulator AtoC